MRGDREKGFGSWCSKCTNKIMGLLHPDHLFPFLAVGFLLAVVGTACSSSKTTSDIIFVVKQGDIEAVKKISTARNVNGTDDAGATPLMWAAYKGNVEMVRFLAEHGADCRKNGVISVMGKDRQLPSNITFYESPLNAAAGEGHLAVVKYLIEECGLSANEKVHTITEFRYQPEDLKDPKGLCGLLGVSTDVVSKHVRETRLFSELGCEGGSLLNKGKMNFENTIVSLLSGIMHRFVVRENVEIKKSPAVQTIKDIAENRKVFDKIYGKFMATRHDYTFFEEKRLGFSPLISASCQGKKNIIEYLLSKEADPNFQYGSGSTALDEALYNYQYEAAELLLQNGARADLFMTLPSSDTRIYSAYGVMPLFSCTPLGMEPGTFNEKMRRLIPLMIKNGAKPDDFLQALAKACICGNRELAEIIVANGIGRDAKIGQESIKEICAGKGIVMDK